MTTNVINITSEGKLDLDPNFEAAKQFLGLYPTQNYFTFATYTDDKNHRENPDPLYILRHGQLEQHWDELVRQNKAGAAIYSTINKIARGKPRKTENIIACEGFAADLDKGATDITRERMEYLKPHAIVQSSPGKVQLRWFYPDVPVKRFTPTQILLSELLNGDRIKDLPRVLRIPGFIHQKDPNNKFLVRLIYVVDPGNRDPIEVFYNKLDELRHAAGINATTELSTAKKRATSISLSTDAALKEPPTLWNEEAETELRSAIDYLVKRKLISFDDYRTSALTEGVKYGWLDVGMMLHALSWGDRGYELWCELSRSHESYSDDVQRYKWNSFGKSDRKPITVRSLYKLAIDNGWKAPQQKSAQDYLTDLGNTRYLIQRHGENLRFIYEWSTWIVWNGTHWQRDNDGEIMRLAKETVEAMFLEAAKTTDNEKRSKLIKYALRCQAAARLEAMIKLAETEPEIVLSATKLNANPYLLGVQNGVIDLQTNTFREGRREDFITLRAGIAFAPNAICPNWKRFLSKITGGNENLIRYMQRAAGYTLTGSVCEEVLFVLHGTGNNGKSTLRETLHKIMGEYAIAADAGLLIERQSPRGATPEIARLHGRRFVAVNETKENDKLNESRVKYITSKDTITGRNLYENYFDFFPTHKVLLTTNHKPVIHGTDTGIWRRIHLWPFTIAIPPHEIKKHFCEAYLLPELSGILNWALEGLAAYRKDGLNPPATVIQATNEYREEMDIIGQWLDERCELDPQAVTPVGAAYNDYKNFTEIVIHGRSMSLLRFCRLIYERFEKSKVKGQRRIVGLRVKTAPLWVAAQPPRER